MMFLKVVAVKVLDGLIGLLHTVGVKLRSVIWKNTTVSIRMVTLSLVINGLRIKVHNLFF